MLIVEQEDGSAGGRDVVEEGQEGLVGWLAETGTEGSEMFRWCVVEGLPVCKSRSRRLERGMEILLRLLVTVER